MKAQSTKDSSNSSNSTFAPVFEARNRDAFTAEEQKLLDTVGVHEAVAGQATQLTRKSVPSHFLNHVPTEVTLRHYQLWREYISSKKPVIDIQVDPVFGSYELTMIGSERRGILADLTETLKSEGLDVISAKIFSLPNHSVMDIFRFDDHEGILADEEKASRLHQKLWNVVSPELQEETGHNIANAEISSRHTTSEPSSSPSSSLVLQSADMSEKIKQLDSDVSKNPSLLAEQLHRQSGDLIAFERQDMDSSVNEKESHHLGGQSFEPVRETDTLSFPFNEYFLHTSRRHSIEIMESVASWNSAPRTPVSNGKKLTKSLLKSFSNLAMVDLETGKEELSNDRMKLDTETRSNMKMLQVDMLSIEYDLYLIDIHNRLWDEYPPWLWFSIHAKTISLFIATVSEEQLDRWFLGIQSLLPDIRTEKYLTKRDLLLKRLKAKCRHKAHRKGLTLFRHVLNTVKYIGNIIYSHASTIHQIEEAKYHSDSIMEDYLEWNQGQTIDILKRQLEAANEQIEHLTRELELSSSRVAILKNKLKLVQRSWEVDFGEIKKLEKIGNGAYSELFKAEWRGTIVAVKLMKAQETSEEVLRQFHDEVNTLSKLRHPNIVLFMGACGRPPNVSIITEFCFGGNVYNALRKPFWKKWTHVDLVYLARDAARGILYLHSNKIIHRDVKSQNLLLDKPIETGRPTIRVADFGLSRTLIGGSNSTTGIMTSETGTYRWMAPEVIRHEHYSEKVDVYSFGVTLWEFFSCEVPFARLTPIQAAFAVADKNLRPDLTISRSGRQFQIPLAWKYLIERCWDAEPMKRPSFGDIICVLNEMEEMEPNQLASHWKGMEESSLERNSRATIS
ncbi:serine/threonine protein kinase [Galdieria sulphuraria]|uniref:non-specific serine/threonine protein kinase n=1 Tax=Galdieria sulphuraria TaxID=130081 RepID=M2WUL1_GALSU|nr:serine/threonine protein kinase [Galdieria sulphuraria]EME27640.1 serine/threonine protein kinase [Galdieria sulphuraria]|eukprot:XP_005704160.1 serine/threonine protein kinase [Galdieria sulphuraria]